MEIKDFYRQEPGKYWTPAKDKHIELDIVEHPEKYSEYIGSIKIDGEWSRWIKVDGQTTVQSRSISKVTGQYGDKTAQVPQLTELTNKLPDGTVLLGELCFWDLSTHSNDVGSITRCLPPKAIERQKNNPLHLYVFDVLMYAGTDLTDVGYLARTKYFDVIKNVIGENNLIHYAQLIDVNTVAAEYDNYLAKGGEGFVLQKKNAIYAAGGRPAWASIKLKQVTEEIELPVCGLNYEDPAYKGNDPYWPYIIDGKKVTKTFYNGWPSSINVLFNGVEVAVASGLTDENREYLKNNGYEGLTATVQAMQIIKESGSLRHPVLKELHHS